MAPLWYCELRQASSPDYAPATFDREPVADKHGRMVQAGSTGPRIRNIRKVAEEHEGLHLGALAAIYGTGAGDA